MILFKKKIIFVHPPKTGGTTIDHLLYKYEFEKNLDDINSNHHTENLIGGFINKYYNIYHLTDGLQHLSINKIKEIYPEQANLFFKIGTIRNPYSRAVSMYNELITINSVMRDFYIINKRFSFTKFLNILKKGKNINTHHLPLVYFFKKKDLDLILEVENFKEDIIKLKSLFNINDDNLINPYKSTTNSNYLNYYKDEKNIDLVNKIFKDDLDEFNYDFQSFKSHEESKNKNPIQIVLIDKKKNSDQKFVMRIINKFFFNLSYSILKLFKKY